jgi:hypothetical protein
MCLSTLWRGANKGHLTLTPTSLLSQLTHTRLFLCFQYNMDSIDQIPSPAPGFDNKDVFPPIQDKETARPSHPAPKHTPKASATTDKPKRKQFSRNGALPLLSSNSTAVYSPTLHLILTSQAASPARISTLSATRRSLCARSAESAP